MNYKTFLISSSAILGVLGCTSKTNSYEMKSLNQKQTFSEKSYPWSDNNRISFEVLHDPTESIKSTQAKIKDPKNEEAKDDEYVKENKVSPKDYEHNHEYQLVIQELALPIRANCFSNLNKLKSICYGSAIFIGSDNSEKYGESTSYLLSCGHMFFNKNNNQLMNSFYVINSSSYDQKILLGKKFWLNLNDMPSDKINKSDFLVGSFITWPDKNAYRKTINLAYALSCNKNGNCIIRCLQTAKKYTLIPDKTTIMICGYPSRAYSKRKDIDGRDITFEPVTKFGTCEKFLSEEGIMRYKLGTLIGHSGSGVFALCYDNEEKQYIPLLIGIHTHDKGGVLFTEEHIKNILVFIASDGSSCREVLGIKHQENFADISMYETYGTIVKAINYIKTE